MLAEKRQALICELVSQRGSVTVTELAEVLDTSESTVRRDLDKLDSAHRLVKVHGGATSLESASLVHDIALAERHGLHVEEKQVIGAFAATLVGPDDFVFVDASSTVDVLIDCLDETRASFVTNSVAHAMALVAKGCQVTVLGGELKSATQSLVGPDALVTLSRYHFTIGFWGTNGITPEAGFTTPDRNEAIVKQVSMEHTDRCYVLADASKLGAQSLVTFADLESATIITAGSIPEAWQFIDNVIEVGM